jgi:hypothetical protein
MTTAYSSVFSSEEIEYLLGHPEVTVAREKLGNSQSGKVYFTVPLTDDLKATLNREFALDFSSVLNLPMRWIVGDSAPHVDSGASEFQHSYLVYLNDSEGEFIVDGVSYPITANVGYKFSEGLSHSTLGTCSVPRLLVGPMNEFAEPVGAVGYAIVYYSNFQDADERNANFIARHYSSYIIGDTVTSGDIGLTTQWRIAGYAGDPLSNSEYYNTVYNNGFDLTTLTTFNFSSINGYFYLYPRPPDPVIPVIYYYPSYADMIEGDNWIARGNYTVGNIVEGDIGLTTQWLIGFISGTNPPSIPNVVYNNGSNLETIAPGEFFRLYPASGSGPAPCFLEGTKILCQVDGADTYLPIESMRPGTLVKTSLNGYKKVELIGKGQLQNPGNNERLEQRLYKCSPSSYPELTEDVYLTGCHSILVSSLTDLQRETLIKQLDRIFVTDKHYRLTAFADERAEPWASEGQYTIWHFALENEHKNMNYGVYASGLLVETCCINRLMNKSGFTLYN